MTSVTTLLTFALSISTAMASTDSKSDSMSGALAQRNFEKVKVLQKSGVKIDAIASDDQTGLMKLAEEGDVSAVKKALSLGAGLDAKNSKGETALWYAVYGGHESLALELIAKGAKTDGVLKESNECLVHYAAKAQLTKLSQKLKTLTPACLKQKNSEGKTPSQIAKEVGDESLAKALSK